MRTILALAAMLLPAPGLSAASGAESRMQADPAVDGTAQPPPTGGAADPVAWVRESYDPARRAAFDAATPPAGAATADAPAGDAAYSATPEFSPRLRALFVEEERYADGEIGRLDFNPFSGANDDDIKRADVTAEDVDGAPDRKIVTARFRNMDADQTITYFWERIDRLWYIDDIAGRTSGEPSGWTLSLILKYGRSSI